MDEATDGPVLRIADLAEGGNGDAPLLEYTNYARKETISHSGGKVYGNWEPSFDGACIGAFQRYVEEGAVIEMREVGRCSSGSTVVQLRSM